MKFAEYEIVYLPKAQWEGVPIPMRYTTEEYYAVEVEAKADGYGVQIRKRRLEEPISHYPEEYDFPRCFATPNRYIKSETLNLSALAEFFYVNICVFLCCIVLRFT